MKAIVLRANGDPSVLKLEDWPDPEPAPHEALVKVGAVGVPYHDIVERNGTLRPGHGLPKILGNEIAGTVVALGADVTSLEVGMRVCAKGFQSAASAAIAATAARRFAGSAASFRAATRSMPQYRRKRWSRSPMISPSRKPACWARRRRSRSPRCATLPKSGSAKPCW